MILLQTQYFQGVSKVYSISLEEHTDRFLIDTEENVRYTNRMPIFPYNDQVYVFDYRLYTLYSI